MTRFEEVCLFQCSLLKPGTGTGQPVTNSKLSGSRTKIKSQVSEFWEINCFIEGETSRHQMGHVILLGQSFASYMFGV